MSRPATVDFSLFWSLPRGQRFIVNVGAKARAKRCLLIQHPDPSIVGLWDAVKKGLQLAEQCEVLDIRIDAGTNISHEIGGVLGLPPLQPIDLASVKRKLLTPVILRPAGVTAVARCEEYCGKFIEACGGADADGDVLLIGCAPAGHVSGDAVGRDVQILSFDGALSIDEMTAYVSVQMIDRPGPADTRFFKALVIEFAGFDAWLAEQLISLRDDELYNLPNALDGIMESDPNRWSERSWDRGTVTTVDGQDSLHTLYERYVSRHSGPLKQAMTDALFKRYWKAALRTLSPWIEERRIPVINSLEDAINGYRKTKGFLSRRVGNQDVEVKNIYDLELGNLIHMKYNGMLVQTPVERDAMEVAFAAKPVRDSIAHGRPPTSEKIVDLIAAIRTFDSTRKRQQSS